MSETVKPMSYADKPVVMDVIRKERQEFYDLIDDPNNWNVQTRCTEWEVRDLVGHMIDVTEGYLSRWEIAKKGEQAEAKGLGVMGEMLNDHAMDFRKLSRDEAISRLRSDREKMMKIFD